MNFKYVVKYKAAGETVVSNATETDFYTLEIGGDEGRYTVNLIPKCDLNLLIFMLNQTMRSTMAIGSLLQVISHGPIQENIRAAISAEA